MRKLLVFLLCFSVLVLQAAAPAGRIREVHLDGAMDGTLTLDMTFSRNVSAVQLEVMDAQRRRILYRSGLKPQKGKLHFSEKSAYPVEPWSAETPATYSLKVSAFTPQGLKEIRVYPFAFRKVEWRRNRLLLNGRGVRIKGLRQTALLPEGTVTDGDLLQAIRSLKQLNINAVSADYRPGDASWATLCDRFGLYVVPAELLDSCTVLPERELRYRYRDIWSAGMPWALEVSNGCSFRSLSDVCLYWSLEADGVPLRSGLVEQLFAAPQETETLDLGITPQQLEALPGTLTLTLRYELKRPWSLLEAGTEIACEQLLLRDERPVLMDCEGPAVTLADSPERCTFSGAGWSLAFDKRSGGLISYQSVQREWLAEPLLPDLPEPALLRFNVLPLEQGYWVEAVYSSGRVGYQLAPDGSLSGVADGTLRMALPASCDRLDFLGLGPWENLPGSCDAALLGRYHQPVSGSGPHTGLRVFSVLDASGNGIRLVSPLDFTAEARAYTPDGRLLTDVRFSAAEDTEFRFVLTAVKKD